MKYYVRTLLLVLYLNRYLCTRNVILFHFLRTTWSKAQNYHQNWEQATCLQRPTCQNEEQK